MKHNKPNEKVKKKGEKNETKKRERKMLDRFPDLVSQFERRQKEGKEPEN